MLPTTRRAGLIPALALLSLLGSACSPHGEHGHGTIPDSQLPPLTASGDAGLEITSFVSGLDNRAFAEALAPLTDQPLPISHDLQDLWEAHGLRMVAVPIEQAPALIASLQTGGGTQRQWLGQAYSWVEAARAQEFPSRVVALDAERIRLGPGALRMLVRSWLEPVPSQPITGESGGGSGGSPVELTSSPGAVLRVELVPQNRESAPPESVRDPLLAQPSIDAETQGLLFSRLYAKMSVPAGYALVILPERPGVSWRTVAAQPAPEAAPKPEVEPPPHSWSSGESDNPWPKRPDSAPAPSKPKPVHAGTPHVGNTPRVGEVVRGGPAQMTAPSTESDTPDSSTDATLGPTGTRVPTLGEALLVAQSNRVGGRSTPPPQRTILVLIPRVPREFHLLGPASAARP